MGSKHSKKKIIDKIGKDYVCPTCDKHFPSTTPVKEINDHTIQCANESVIHTEPNANYDINSMEDNDLDFFFSTGKFTSRSGKPKNFQDKVKDLRSYINTIKISWMEGCDTLSIQRDHVLSESMSRIKQVNLLKEVKIDFKGEVSYDAGGIIREWFMVLIQELESKEMKLFEKSDCDDFSFVPHRLLKANYDTLEYFRFIGKLIAKALLDNITINLCFNKIIYKMIIDEPVTLEDMKFIDNALYSSLINLKTIDPTMIEDLCMYYVYEYNDENNKLVTEELIPNGAETLVKDINDYIEKRIEFLVKKYKIFIDAIKETLYSYIPKRKFIGFNSYEFELLVCGKPFIDIQEWKTNTIYKGKFSKSHKVVCWFWEALSDHTQEELSKFLQFSTGSSRVPINGFAKLESNRGEIAKFCLNSVEYNKKGNNYIKAHTCFNRIDVPIYKTEEEVEEAIKCVLNNEIVGFGID